MRSHERGSALALSLAVLAILFSFATTLVVLTSVERTAAAAWVDERRATLAAEAGVQRAVSELSAIADEPLTSTTEDAPWAYVGAGGGALQVGVPIEKTARCSFHAGTVTLADGTQLPISGSLGATYAQGGDFYSLKVLDVTGQIDLNDERPGLAEMLDVLGRAIALDLGRDPVSGRGAAIVALRGSFGTFATKRQLEPLLGPQDWRLLADFVTVDGWRDPAARRPSPRSPNPASGAILPDFVSERRCPVNVNSAPRPVLVALFANVNGLIDLPDGTLIPGVPVSFAQACEVADRVIARRRSTLPTEGPFRDVTDLADFLATLKGRVLDPNQTRFLWGVLDPNLRVTALNPETTARVGEPKYALLYRTTEAAFFPHGRFEVTALGRILSKGVVIAESCRTATVAVYNVERQTTQLDFETRALAATSDNMTTFPDPVRRLGPLVSSPDGGYAALCDPRVQTTIANRSFVADYTVALDAGTGANIPQGSRIQSTGQTTGGDLAPDGTYTSDTKRVLYYSSAPSPREGSLEVWLKLEWNPAKGPLGSIVFATNSLGPSNVLVTNLKGASDGDALVLDLNRKLYGDGATSFTGGGPTETRARAVVRGAGTYGEWHHVRVQWKNFADASLFVDGKAAATTLQLGGETWPPPPDVPTPYTDRMYVGGEGLEFRRMTVDDLVLDDGTVSEVPLEFAPPERYPARDPDWIGKYDGCFGPFEQDFEFGTIYWTERLPAKWGTYTYQQGDFEVEATSGDPLLPNKLNMPKPWRRRLRAPMPPLSSPVVDAWMNPGMAPTLVPPGDRIIRYEIRFLCPNPGGLPVDVSPVLDDVTVVYRTRPRFLRLETDDD